MVEVQMVDRKSPVLSASSLACLRHVATINLTAGCAHECRYCYTRGYRNHPGEGKVALYANTLEKLRAELRRKRGPAPPVYFSPSSDLFQPVPQVLDMTYEVLKLLFEFGARVTFLTKGGIPSRHMELLARNAGLVHAEIGLIGLDNSVLRLFEPMAASAGQRLKQIKQLVERQIKTEVRIDPIIPGFTDDEASLRELLGAIASCGIKSAAASVLFLRPAITASLRRSLPPSDFAKLTSALAGSDRMGIHSGNSSVRAMPPESRRRIYALVESVATEFGIKVKTCACKNPDLAKTSCGISGEWQPSAGISLPLLFQ